MNKGALIVSIIGLVTWIFPPLGVSVSWAGMMLGIMGQKNGENKLAKPATIIGIIGLVLCLLNVILGLMM